MRLSRTMISKGYSEIHKGFFLFSFLLFSLIAIDNASATVTVLGVTGATNFTLADGTNNPTIYGAHALPVSTSGDGTNTIDSCAEAGAATLLRPCSFASIYKTLSLSIALKTDTKALMVSTSRVTARTSGAGSDNLSPSSTVVVATDGTFTFPVQWQSVCGLYSTSDVNCEGYINSTFDITVSSSNGATSEKVTINLNMRWVLATAAATEGTSTDCSSVTQATGGLCYFSLLPGDEKVYLSNVLDSTAFPTTPTSSFQYTKAVFFYKETAAGNNVTLADDYFLIDVDSNKSPPLKETRLTGLQNDSQYCFAMASMDATGVVSYLTPLGGRKCATPKEVFGILDDKKCFIATAAWGSEMDSHVEEFRAFRNRILLQTTWGKKFVSWYYAHSPAAARVIRESEVLRTAARGGLWPILLFIRASSTFGFELVTSILLSLLSTLAIAAVFYMRRKSRVRDVK